MTIIVLLFAAIAIAVASCVLFWWSARRDALREQAPPLVFPLTPSRPQAHANATNGTNGTNGSHRTNGNGASHPADRQVVRPFVVEPPHATHATQANPTSHANHGNHVNHVDPVSHRRPVRPRTSQYDLAAHDTGEYRLADHDNAETVRFVRPSDPDAAVQLLPGHLEVLEGATPHREIRFMRIPGESPHIILGREIRLSPHYVGLGSPMVSRRHARLDFADNQWIVKNLSRTNPLIVNDDALFDTDVARPLADGDRLELGDVVLRFHAH